MAVSKRSQDGTGRSIHIISASGWLFKKKSISMHGNMNVKFDNEGCYPMQKRHRFQFAVLSNMLFLA